MLFPKRVPIVYEGELVRFFLKYAVNWVECDDGGKRERTSLKEYYTRKVHFHLVSQLLNSNLQSEMKNEREKSLLHVDIASSRKK